MGELEPRGFSGIIGQEKAKRFLKGVMARDKIPHAYLFTGIAGIGKTSTAMALAMALNCRAPEAEDSCGRCPACRQMRGGNSPDFVALGPEGRSIKIDQIRQLNRSLGFAPVSGKYRVCVIQKAEAMTEEAANSFLKTLEEPPPGNIFILNAVEPRDLLPTVVSRCQKVPFQPLPVEGIRTELLKRTGVSEDAALALARISEGSLGRALRMCEGDFVDKRRKWLSLLTELPGFSEIRAMEAIAACIKEDRKGDSASDGGESGAMDVFEVWKSWYRDMLVLKVGGPHELVFNADFPGKLKTLADGFTLEQLLESFSFIERTQRDLRRMRNVVLAAGVMALGLRRLSGAE